MASSFTGLPQFRDVAGKILAFSATREDIATYLTCANLIPIIF